MSLLHSDKGSFIDKCKDAYNKYRHHMFAVALSILNNETLAENAVHDAFVTIMEDHCFPDDPQKIKPYLTVAARNKAIDILRKEQYYADDEPLEYQLGTVSDKQSDELNLSLDLLPEDHRQLLVMHYYLGFSMKEIAKYKKVSYSTILRRFSEAKEMLKDIYLEEG